MVASCPSRTRSPARSVTRSTPSRRAPSASSGRFSCRSATSCSCCREWRLDDVRRVSSHWQALAQCERYLSAHEWLAVPAADTAGAARELAASGDSSAAAIASRAAAARYGLEIAAADIQDADHNVTRFAVLVAADAEPPAPDGPMAPIGGDRETLVTFETGHQSRRPLPRARCIRRGGHQPLADRVATIGRRPVAVPVPGPGQRRCGHRAAARRAGRGCARTRARCACSARSTPAAAITDRCGSCS